MSIMFSALSCPVLSCPVLSCPVLFLPCFLPCFLYWPYSLHTASAPIQRCKVLLEAVPDGHADTLHPAISVYTG